MRKKRKIKSAAINKGIVLILILIIIFLLLLLGNLNYKVSYYKKITGRVVDYSTDSADIQIAEQIAENNAVSNVDVREKIKLNVDDLSRKMDFETPSGKIGLKFDLLNYSEWVKREAEEETKAEYFNVNVSESSEKYKWGYNVRLKDLNFLARIDVSADEKINLIDNQTIRIGNNYLSFSDLAEQGYSLSINEPAVLELLNESLNATMNITLNATINMTNETISNFTLNITNESEATLNISNVTIPKINDTIGNATENESDINETEANETNSTISDIEINETDEEYDAIGTESETGNNTTPDNYESADENTENGEIVNEKNDVELISQENNEEATAEKSEEEMAEPSDENLGELVTANIIMPFTGFFINGYKGLTGFVISENLSENNFVSVYVQREFDNESYRAGDVINLDPMIIIIESTPGNVSGCMTIDTAGEYQLINSIYYNDGGDCITIQSDDVTLNGNGYEINSTYLESSSDSGSGFVNGTAYNDTGTEVFRYHVNPYIIMNGTRYYYGGSFFNTITIYSDASYSTIDANLSWTPAFGADGYRVIFDDSYSSSPPCNYYGDYYIDFPGYSNTSFLDNIGCSAWTNCDGGYCYSGSLAISGMSGIYNSGNQNVTIKNISVNSFNYGIYIPYQINLINSRFSKNTNGIILSSSSNNTLTNITANNNNEGIISISSSNNTLTNIIANNNFGSGISLSGSNHNLTSITANDNTYGISFSSSSNNSLTNITANNNSHSGIWVYVSNSVLTNITANNNVNYGIYLVGSNNTLTNAKALSNKYGFFMTASSNNTLKNCNFTDNLIYNLYLYNIVNSPSFSNLNHNIDTTNVIDGNYKIYYNFSANNYDFGSIPDAGFVLCNSCNNVSYKDMNLSHKAYVGAFFYNTTNSNLNNVTANNNYYGVYLNLAVNTSLYNIIANNNAQYGIYAISSPNNNYINITTNNNQGNNAGFYTSANNNSLTNITANNNVGYGVYVSSSNNILRTITANNNTLRGVYISGSNLKNNTVIDVIANNNAQRGVDIGSSNSNYTNIIANNNILDGIYFSGQNNTLTNLTANNNIRYGIQLISFFSNNMTSFIVNNNTQYSFYLQVVSNNTFSNGIINNSKMDAIYFVTAPAINNIFNNITITNTNASYYDLKLDTASINGTQLIDTAIANYSFKGVGGTLVVENSSAGKVEFTSAVNGSGNCLYGCANADIQISNNLAYVNSTRSSGGLNRSANITLYNIPILSNPYIKYNGISVCNSATNPSCFNFTSLNAGNVSFNVSSWSNYSIGNSITVNIIYPLNATYGINVSSLNYSYFDELGYCWHSNSSGAWNSTAVGAGTNFSNVISKEGGNSWTVYCNDSVGNMNSSSVSFYKDTVAPAINLTSPVSGASYSGSSYNVNFTFNVSDDSEIANCSAYANGIEYANTTSIASSAINGINATLSAGTYNAYVNCTDLLNNRGNSSTVTFTIIAPSSAGSSGGGGGSGGYSTSFWRKTVYETLEASENGTITLSERERVVINIYETNYSIGVVKQEQGYSIIYLDGILQENETFFIGEPKKYDLNNDGYYDIEIEAASFSDNQLQVKVSQINEFMGDAVEIKVKTLEDEVQNKSYSETPIAKGIKNFIDKYNLMKIVWIGLSVIAVLMIVLIIVAVRHVYDLKRFFIKEA